MEKLLDLFNWLTSFSTAAALWKNPPRSLCTQSWFVQTDFSPEGDVLVAQLRCVQNLLSKPVSLHPAGMKLSPRPAELSQHPEKPPHFPHSQLLRSLRRGVPIEASVPGFDCRSDLFRWGGAAEAGWCKNPSPPDSATSGSSPLLFHSQQRAAPLPRSRAGAGSKLLQSAQTPPRERWEKKRWKKNRERDSQEEP